MVLHTWRRQPRNYCIQLQTLRSLLHFATPHFGFVIPSSSTVYNPRQIAPRKGLAGWGWDRYETSSLSLDASVSRALSCIAGTYYTYARFAKR